MKFSKTRIVLVSFGLVIGLLILLAAAIFVLPVLGNEVVRANPELTDMRMPMLILGDLILAAVGVVMLLGLRLFGLAYGGKEFTQTTVRTLRLIGWIFFFAILPLIAIILYTQTRVMGSITNIYFTIGAGGFFIAGNLFHLLAELFAKGSGYKSDHDLTI